MANSPSKQDYVALAGFRKALRKFLHFVEEGVRKEGLTPQQHQLLLMVRGHPDREWRSVGELADALKLRHHATVGLVDRCQAAGFVERTPDPDDRRMVRVSLTPKGSEVLDALTMRNLRELRGLGALKRELDALNSE
jgi:DNA-binding MarR family transcriptional regulator